MIRSRFGERVSVTLETGAGLTQQSMKDECDINRLMERYRKTGQLPDLVRKNPQYGDFSAVPDFLEAQNVIIRAQEQFDALPAKVRERFGNDPAKMLAFVADPKNGDELVKLGLAEKRKAPASADAKPAEPAASAEPAAGGGPKS